MTHLGDSNVFLDIAVEQHAHHSAAAAWFRQLEDADTLCFCRATRISFLRLLTQKIAPGYHPLTNREAWSVLDQLLSDEAIGFAAEPDDLEPTWRRFSEIDSVSPKRWMDAYLAAFASSAGLRLVTLDKDFQTFESQGLNLLLLS
jgi:uncharacterized protein